MAAGKGGVADRDHGHGERVQRGLSHLAAAGKEEIELLAVLGRFEQADCNGLLVGPAPDLPTADIAAGHLFHEIVQRQRKRKVVALRAAEFQFDMQGHAKAVFLDVQPAGGLDGQAAIDLPLGHLRPPLQLQGPAGPQRRFDGFVGPLRLPRATVDGQAQANLGLRFRHAEGDRGGRGRGQPAGGARHPPTRPSFRRISNSSLCGPLPETCSTSNVASIASGALPPLLNPAGPGAGLDDLQAGWLAVQVGPGQHAAAEAEGNRNVALGQDVDLHLPGKV